MEVFTLPHSCGLGLALPSSPEDTHTDLVTTAVQPSLQGILHLAFQARGWSLLGF